MLRDLKAAWELSIKQLLGLPEDLGQVAEEALQLCSLLAPDGVPVEVLVRAARELGSKSRLRRFLFPGTAGDPPHAVDLTSWAHLGGRKTNVLRALESPGGVDDAMQRMETVVHTLVR